MPGRTSGRGDRSRHGAYRPIVVRWNRDMLPTLLVDGYVAGVWRPTEKGIEATAFHPLPAGVRDELGAEAHALTEFLVDREPDVHHRYRHWWDKFADEGAETRVLGTHRPEGSQSWPARGALCWPRPSPPRWRCRWPAQPAPPPCRLPPRQRSPPSVPLIWIPAVRQTATASAPPRRLPPTAAAPLRCAPAAPDRHFMSFDGRDGGRTAEVSPLPGLTDLPALLEEAEAVGLHPSLHIHGAPAPGPADDHRTRQQASGSAAHSHQWGWASEAARSRLRGRRSSAVARAGPVECLDMRAARGLRLAGRTCRPCPNGPGLVGGL
ncbi:DNA glycosylase AlkZ-like family protein [Streptomyces sp. HUAS TT7]|uniref:DNA glycosylase AlkZ-like family protein n=1 Tax=Streptomyces sp. HUAS TT7 TaxID=3447507 RepID=UPI003F6562D9